MTIGIREATYAEIHEVVEMIAALHREMTDNGGIVRDGQLTRAWIRQSAEKAMNGSGLVLVALHGGELAGALLAIEGHAPYEHDLGRVAYGLGTYVLPAHRHCGIASELYEAAKVFLHERGYMTYVGAYLTRNAAVQPLLARIGFVGFEMNVRMEL